MKKYLIPLLVLVVLIIILTSINSKVDPIFDGRNSTFNIDNVPVSLVNGSVSNGDITTKYFGSDVEGDVNFDDKLDFLYLVTQENNTSSSTAYYIVAALRSGKSFTTTDALLIGEKITPRSVKVEPEIGEVEIIYVDQAGKEAMKTVLLDADGKLSAK